MINFVRVRRVLRILLVHGAPLDHQVTAFQLVIPLIQHAMLWKEPIIPLAVRNYKIHLTAKTI